MMTMEEMRAAAHKIVERLRLMLIAEDKRLQEMIADVRTKGTSMPHNYWHTLSEIRERLRAAELLEQALEEK